MLPPFPALLAAADATKSLRVTTLVLNNDLRHPSLVAREAAALHSLTGGRFELGIGAGHAAPEYASIGVPFDPPKVRVQRLAEAVGIFRPLLAGETVTFTREHYSVREHAVFPPQPLGVPVLIGGNGRSLLRLAACEADIVGFTGLGRTLPDGQTHDPSGFGPAAVDERVALVREAAGPRLPSLEFNALVQAVIPGDPAEGSARLARRLPGLSPREIAASPFVLLGSPPQMAAALQQRRECWGFTYYSVFAHSMDSLAPVIALVR
jgi:probable F420-dependent oxidoreductase